jgi:hypothetical protein
MERHTFFRISPFQIDEGELMGIPQADLPLTMMRTTRPMAGMPL